MRFKCIRKIRRCQRLRVRYLYNIGKIQFMPPSKFLPEEERKKIRKVLDQRYRAKNRERILATMQKWRDEHRDEYNEYCRTWAAKNPEKKRIFTHNWSVTHRDNKNRSARKWAASHPIERRERLLKWTRKNPDKVQVYGSKRRALKRDSGGYHTAADVAKLFDLQGGKCAACKCKVENTGKLRYHVDHVQPLARGGSDGAENLQLLCKSCNCRKYTMHPSEWALLHGRLFV